MGKVYRLSFIVVLLTFICRDTFSEEINEETQPYYEYVQIFRSIPTLFEYLLDALEERPEMLEKNDVTLYNRNIDLMEDSEESETSDKEKEENKRDVNYDDVINSQAQSSQKDEECINKRQVEDSTEVIETTVAYEYGNSKILMNAFYESTEKYHNSPENSDDNNLSADRRIKRDRLIPKKRIVGGLKAINPNFGVDDDDLIRRYEKPFLGFENFFALDIQPEDIEERCIMAENLLEDYNSKTNEEN